MKEILPSHLPPDWQEVPLECVIERISNGITKRQTKDGQGFAVSRIETISQGVVDFSRVGYLTGLSLSEVETYRLQAGDILFSHINSDLHLGKTAVVSMNADPLLHGMNLLLIRVNQKKILPVFLHWLFNYYRVAGLFMSIAQHAVNQSSINQAKLKNLPVVLPPITEQREIVAEIEKHFTRLEAGVAGLRHVQASLKRYRAAVLKAACEGKLVSTEAELARQEGRTYETGAQFLEHILTQRRQKWIGKGKYKEPIANDAKILLELPEGWAWASVDQIAEVTLGRMLDKTKHKTGRQLPYLRNINVRWGRVETHDLLQMFFEEDQLERYSLQAGDILICEGGEPGRAAVWDGRMLNMMYQKALHRIRFFGPVRARYLVFLLEFLARTGRLDRWFTGSTIKHFTREAFISLPIPLPPPSEQDRIVAEVERHLSVVEELEAVVNANLQRAGRLRQAILQQAFEGKIAVTS